MTIGQAWVLASRAYVVGKRRGWRLRALRERRNPWRMAFLGMLLSQAVFVLVLPWAFAFAVKWAVATWEQPLGAEPTAEQVVIGKIEAWNRVYGPPAGVGK